VTILQLELVDLGGDGPTLLVGPSLGTEVTRLWAPVADLIRDSWHVIGWNLPGHGRSPRATNFAISDLASALQGQVDL
jgi:3-oxoadipate enol-lactonase / 4-carboxymuconolactone decarboxylase